MSKKTDLETHICDVQKGLKDDQVVLKQKEIALTHAQEDMEEKRVDWAHHKTNHKFMQFKATIVDVKEYRGVLQLLKDAKEKFNEAATKVHGLSKTVLILRKQVDGRLAEIARAKDALASMGEVLEFRRTK